MLAGNRTLGGGAAAVLGWPARESRCSARRAPSPRIGAPRLPPNPLSGCRPQAVTDLSGGRGRSSGPGFAVAAISGCPRASCSLCAPAPQTVAPCRSLQKFVHQATGERGKAAGAGKAAVWRLRAG